MLPKQMSFGNIVIMIKINSLLKVRRLCAARINSLDFAQRGNSDFREVHFDEIKNQKNPICRLYKLGFKFTIDAKFIL